jgi:lysophospholipase L1-like esterase
MKKIVCHGDSLTEAGDAEKGYVWTALVENRLGIEMINSGIGGDTSGGLLGRFYADAIQHRPDMIIIVAGTNDLWWDLEINTIQANIYAMACQGGRTLAGIIFFRMKCKDQFPDDISSHEDGADDSADS